MGLPDLTVHRRAQTRAGIKKCLNLKDFKHIQEIQELQMSRIGLGVSVGS